MDNNKREAEERIELIKMMMNESQQFFIDNGFNFVYWGFIVVVSIVLTYLFMYLCLETFIIWIWIVSYSLAITIFIIVLRNDKKTYKVRNFITRIYSVVWQGCLISTVLITLVSIITDNMISGIPMACISAIMGTAYYITAFLKKSVMMKIFAIIWWINSVVMFFINPAYTYGAVAALVFLLLFIPGLILYTNHKKEIKKEK